MPCRAQVRQPATTKNRLDSRVPQGQRGRAGYRPRGRDAPSTSAPNQPSEKTRKSQSGPLRRLVDGAKAADCQRYAPQVGCGAPSRKGHSNAEFGSGSVERGDAPARAGRAKRPARNPAKQALGTGGSRKARAVARGIDRAVAMPHRDPRRFSLRRKRENQKTSPCEGT